MSDHTILAVIVVTLIVVIVTWPREGLVPWARRRAMLLSQWWGRVREAIRDTLR